MPESLPIPGRVILGTGAVSPGAFGTARYLADLYQGSINIGARPSLEAFLGRPDSWFVQNGAIPVKHRVKIPRRMTRVAVQLNRWYDARQVWALKPEILHQTYYESPIRVAPGTRVVVTLYDMIHELFPNRFSRYDRAVQFKYSSLLSSNRIICISHNTRDDLLNLWPEFEEKSAVVHLGVSDQFFNGVLPPISTRSRDVLFVGSRRGYKGFWILAEAFAKLVTTNGFGEAKLVIFGGEPLTVEDHRKFSSMGIKREQIVKTGGSQDILIELYSRVGVLVYPSEYEGFGYPPLEAMGAGCPVIVQNKSSFPEVVGGVGVLLDSLSVENLVDAISATLTDGMPEERLSAGQKRSRGFSINRMAEETALEYALVLKS